jgi:hypothetical protein
MMEQTNLLPEQVSFRGLKPRRGLEFSLSIHSRREEEHKSANKLAVSLVTKFGKGIYARVNHFDLPEISPYGLLKFGEVTLDAKELSDGELWTDIVGAKLAALWAPFTKVLIQCVGPTKLDIEVQIIVDPGDEKCRHIGAATFNEDERSSRELFNDIFSFHPNCKPEQGK